MVVDQCHFCNEILGFGQYSEVPNRFVSGQQVLIYCQIENYGTTLTQEQGQPRFQARLRGSIVIKDRFGRIVKREQYAEVQDIARQKRNDFYMYFPVTIPELDEGTYSLTLSVEDLVSGRSAPATVPLEFTVFRGPKSRTAGQPSPPSR